MAAARISLYLDLEEGKRANLEVAARIALAWDGLIKETFAVLDPSAEVQIELRDAADGSLGFNTLVRAISRVAGQNPYLTGVISGILATFFLNPIDHFADHFWQRLYQAVGHDDAFFSPEQEAQIREQVAIALRDNVAREQKREIFLQAHRDPKILGIGATPAWNARPQIILPRSHFEARAGIEAVQREDLERETISQRLHVTLLTAKLEPKELMWRFNSVTMGPFSAKMADPDFIRALEEHRTGADLAIGVQMDVLLQTKRELKDGVWSPVERIVKRVYSPIVSPSPTRPELPYDQ